MSQELLERVTRLETYMETLADAQRETNTSIKELTDTLRTTVLTRDEAAEIKADVRELDGKLDTLKGRVDRAEGGLVFARWLVGILGVGNIGLIIYTLAQAAPGR